MENPDPKEYVQRIKDLRVQISALKKELNKLNREKESWYSKRSAINKKISDLITGVKSSKDERNEITGQVKGYKDERDVLNKEISSKVKELKELKDKYESTTGGRPDTQTDPNVLRKQIEKLDYVLQTQPMSFDKEQKLMKEMKSLKKQMADLGGAAEEWAKISTLTREVSKLRKKSNLAHREIQKHAASSQTKHESVIEKSKEIDALKEEENAAYEKFKEFKEKFTEKNNELKALLKEADEVKEILAEHNIQVEEDQRQVQAKEIKAKAKEVSQKMKVGGKLTTEDLLVFQKSLK